MAGAMGPPLLDWRLAFVLTLLITAAQGFFPLGSKRFDVADSSRGFPSAWHGGSHASCQESLLANPYATALSELQGMIAKPPCYQIAARLLVTNCQILDKQDDATVYTDTGRAAADFVASFALSLAICDLERGSFEIPASCSKFREPALASIPAAARPYLHVTTAEIDGCLAGFKHSSSAWSTWVSYKHKALGFCEAARADNAKDQSIRVHQEIIHILDRLATQVPDAVDMKLQSLNGSLQDANLAAEHLKPQLHHFSAGLAQIENLLEAILIPNAQQSADSIAAARDEANSLGELLAMLLAGIQARNTEMEEHHEIALRMSAGKAKEEFGAIMVPLAAAVASSLSLQNEIERSQLRMAQLARQQESFETGMKRLDGLAESLLIKQQKHQETIEQAQTALQGILDVFSPSLALFKSWTWDLVLKWLPWCLIPLCARLALFVGNYKVPPSPKRNLLLSCSGGVVGLVGLLLYRQHDSFAACLGNVAGASTSWVSQYLSRATHGNGITLHVRDEMVDNSTAEAYDDVLDAMREVTNKH